MSGSRVLMLAAAALLALLGGLWWSGRDRAGDSVTTGALVLPDLKAAIGDVSEIRISKGDGQRVRLLRGAAGWQVKEREYAADTGRVRKLLLDLAALSVREEKTRDPANYSKLGVEDADTATAASTRVDVVTPKRTWSLLLGKQDTPRAGFARVVDRPESVLAAPLITANVDPTGWLDRLIVDIPAKDIRSVMVTPAAGPTYTIQKAKAEDANYAVVGLPADAKLIAPAAANGAAEAFAALTFNDVRKNTATAKPTVKATVTRFDGKSIEFVGARDGDRAYLAAISGDAELTARLTGWEYEVPAWKFDQIFKPRDELLAK